MLVLGRKEEALREGRRAVELFPVEKDAINGPAMIRYLAMIAAWVGDKDLACEQLAIAARLPGGVSYGKLSCCRFGTRCAAIRVLKKSSPLFAQMMHGQRTSVSRRILVPKRARESDQKRSL